MKRRFKKKMKEFKIAIISMSVVLVPILITILGVKLTNWICKVGDE